MRKISLINTFIFALIVLAISTMVYTTIQFRHVKNEISTTTHSMFSNSVRSSYDLLDNTINEAIKSYLKGIAVTTLNMVKSGREVGLTEERIEHLLDNFVASTHIGEHGYISITDKNGRLLYHPYMKGKNVSDLDFIQEQLHHTETFSQYEWTNPGESEPHQKAAYSIQRKDGSVIQVTVYKDEMLSLANSHRLKEKLAQYRIGKTSFIYIIDQNGKTILKPDGVDNIASQALFDAGMKPFLEHVKAHPTGSFSYPVNVNGQRSIETITYRLYPDFNWIIASGISESELTHASSALYRSLITEFISILAVIISLIMIMTVRHRKQILAEKKDYLTGLDNRRRFMELAQVVERTSSNIYSIILFDIDKFKNINDTLGHNEGDKVIQEVAQVLKHYESSNVFVSRHGGEEFIIMLNDVPESEAFTIAESIRIQISKISNLKCRFTISAGVYEACSDSGTLDEAIAYADKALYEAKESGRNKVMIYKPSENEAE